jgi:hypothetical protein
MMNDKPVNDRNSSAFLCGLLGAGAALEGKKLETGILFALASTFLEELQMEIERQRREAFMRELVSGLFSSTSAAPKQIGDNTGVVVEAGTLSAHNAKIIAEVDSRWREIIIHPSVVLLLGKRGSGKSALGYRLLELFRYGLTPYVLGVPTEGRKLLPDWIGTAQGLDEIPVKSIVLVDEAYLLYHARESLAAHSRQMSRILNLSRQRGQTIIFVTQEARQIDRNISSSANVVVFKDLGMLQLEYDRPELSRIANNAKQAFARVAGDRRKWSYVYSPECDFMDLLENTLPSFWSGGLSRIFGAGAEPSHLQLPKPLTVEQRIQKAKELHQKGLSYGTIAKTLNVTKGTAFNYVKDYPYKTKSSF